MTTSTALSLSQLNLMRGEQSVLNDLTLTLAVGEIGCLLGPSGCGKTSLLRAIAGFESIHVGHIEIAGKTVATSTMQLPPEQRGIGMVFQDYALFPHLSVAENIAFGLHQLSRQEAQTRTAEWLSRLHLSELSQRLPHQLSGGQQQRVALARALAPQPQLLLMDEPFANLDATLRESLSLEVRDLLKSLGASALLVTHDPMEAFTLADKIGVMVQGKIVQWDTPYHVYHQPKNRFVANFVGLGSFLPAHQGCDNQIESLFGRFTGRAEGALCGTSIEMLIRPDDIRYAPDSPLTARVSYRAFRGPDTLYRLCFGEQQVSALFPSHIQLGIGDEVGVSFDTGGHVVAFTCEA
jgi:iron(III) transport system ATP-binding protein